MAWDIQDRFPTWGETGEYPVDGFFYEGGDQVNEKHQDALWNGIKNFEQNVRDSLTDIDSDQDGTVDAADDLETNGSASKIIDTTNNIDLLRANENGPVEIPNGDLRLATEQAIEDGDGVKRFIPDSDRTRLLNENGDNMIIGGSALASDVIIPVSKGFRIDDKKGSFDAVQYETDPSAGLLRIANAGISVESKHSSYPTSNGLNLAFDGTVSRIRARDGGANGTLSLEGQQVNIASFSGLIDTSQNGNQPADLRIATGRAIEDGSGTRRVEFDSSFTSIRHADGAIGLQLDKSVRSYVSAYSTGPFSIRDQEGGFDAVTYTTDSSTGTLELTNASLSLTPSNPPSANQVAVVGSRSSTESWYITFSNGNGNQSKIRNNNGELEGVDSSGNATTLT